MRRLLLTVICVGLLANVGFCGLQYVDDGYLSAIGVDNPYSIGPRDNEPVPVDFGNDDQSFDFDQDSQNSHQSETYNLYSDYGLSSGVGSGYGSYSETRSETFVLLQSEAEVKMRSENMLFATVSNRILERSQGRRRGQKRRGLVGKKGAKRVGFIRRLLLFRVKEIADQSVIYRKVRRAIRISTSRCCQIRCVAPTYLYDASTTFDVVIVLQALTT